MPPKQPELPWKSQVHGGIGHAQSEAHRVVRYIDEELVPVVRLNVSIALKAAADPLHRIAQRLDRANREPPTAPPPKRP